MGNSESNNIKLLYQNYSVIKAVNDQKYGEGKVIQHKQTHEEYFLSEMNLTDETEYKNRVYKLDKRSQNKHPNLINLIKTYYQEDDQFCSRFYKIYIVMEYIPTNLYDLIELRGVQNKLMAEEQLWKLLTGAIDGLNILQQNLISHQCIRPDTIFVQQQDLLVKISDPSETRKIPTFQLLFIGQEHPFCYYVSPALMNSLKTGTEPIHNLYKSDVYSLGMTMLHTAQLKDCDDCYDYPRKSIIQSQVSRRLQNLEQQYSPQYVALIKSMLQSNEDNRPDFIQLKQIIQEVQLGQPNESREEFIEIKQINKPINIYESFKNPNQDLQASYVQESPSGNFTQISVRQSIKPVVVNDFTPTQIKQSNVDYNQSYQVKQSTVSQRPVPSVKQSQVQQQQEGMPNLFKPDQCDILKLVNINIYQEIPLSQKPSSYSEPDQNIGNQLGVEYEEDVKHENIEFDDNPQYQQQDDKIYNNLMPITSMNDYQQGAQKKFNQDIFPVSYESYKINSTTENNTYKMNTSYQQNASMTTQQKTDYYVDQKQYSVKKEKVIETYSNGSRYEGEKLNGMRHGHGCFFYYDNGGIYEGQWFENKMHGQGTLYYASHKPAYEGQWVNDKFEGQGTLHNEKPQILIGEFDYRDFDNVGEYWSRYTGGFHDDNKEGNGILYLSNGERLEAYFLGDLVCGPGVFYKKNGQIIEGRWWQNKFQ